MKKARAWKRRGRFRLQAHRLRWRQPPRNQIFLEGEGLRGDIALRREGNAGAVENKAIVAAHLIHVNDWAVMIDGNRAQHFQAQGTLVEGVGRGGHVQQHRSSLLNDFRHRVALIALAGPEILVVPNVLADRDAQLLAAKPKNRLAIRGLKVARFIKDVIGGKQHLALLENHTPPAEQCGFIGDGLACPIRDAPGVAHNGGQRNLGSKLLQSGMVSLDEGGAFEKVLRKIAAQTEFGEYCEIGAALLGLRRQAQDASRVSCKVANCWIELSERYLHARTLEYGWNSQIANGGAHSVVPILASALPARFPSEQAGDSLPGPQLAIKKHTELRERLAELATFEQMGRIPRAARKIKLRTRVSLKQDNAARAKCAGNLREKRPLQILNAQNQAVRTFRNLGPLEICLHQCHATVRRPSGPIEAEDAPHGDANGPRSSFEDSQSRAGPIHRRDMLAARRKKQRVSSAAACDVERGPGRQERQQLAHNAGGLESGGFSRQPVLCIPLGLT